MHDYIQPNGLVTYSLTIPSGKIVCVFGMSDAGFSTGRIIYIGTCVNEIMKTTYSDAYNVAASTSDQKILIKTTSNYGFNITAFIL